MNSIRSLSLLVVLIVISMQSGQGAVMKEQPDWLHRCTVGTPEFVPCATSNYQEILKQLVPGIPGLNSIRTIDPFRIKRLQIDESGNPSVNIKIDLKDADMTGLGKIKVKEVTFNKNVWVLKGSIKKLKIVGQYTIDGRILIIPLTGTGDLLVEAENVDVVLATKVGFHEKDGLQFQDPKKTKIDFDLTGLKVNFDNLFNGNKALSDSTNNLLNQSWQEVHEVLKPSLVSAMEQIFMSLQTEVFKFIPATYFLTNPKEA